MTRPRGTRMFVALVPPREAVEDLDAFLEPRRESGPFRWALPEQFHVTLSFLAAVADRHLDELVERLERAGRRRTVVRHPDRRRRSLPQRRAGRGWCGPGWTSTSTGATELDRLATGARAAAVPHRHPGRRPAVPAAHHGRPARPSRPRCRTGCGCSTPTPARPGPPTGSARRLPPRRGDRQPSPLRDGREFPLAVARSLAVGGRCDRPTVVRARWRHAVRRHDTRRST